MSLVNAINQQAFVSFLEWAATSGLAALFTFSLGPRLSEAAWYLLPHQESQSCDDGWSVLKRRTMETMEAVPEAKLCARQERGRVFPQSPTPFTSDTL